MAADRLPLPEDPEAERSLVSCVWAGLRDRDGDAARALGEVEPDAFLVPQARSLWAALRGLYGRGEALDPALIHGELKRLKQASALGGYVGVMEALSFNEWGQPEPLVRRLNELHNRRRMVALAGELDRKARDLVVEPAQAIGEVSTGLMALSLGASSERRRSGMDLLERLKVRKPFRDPSQGQKLFWFPIEQWNEAVECAPGHVIIVGAAAKTGKTAMVVDSMVCTADQGASVGLVSLEMDHDEVESRIAARMTSYDSRKFLREEWGYHVVETAVTRHAAAFPHLHWWCHPSGVPWARVEAEIREMVRLDGVRAVVIDYFTLIAKPSGGKSASDASLWGALSTAIKRLAQELRICIVLLCQLNREGAEGEPHKWHLRETGQLEQDANAIVFLWKEREDGPVFGKVSDNRSGPVVPKKELLFEGSTSTFKTPTNYTTSAPSVPGWG